MIPLNECRDGYLYEINARNAGMGIFDANEKGFVIARTKFSEIYLFVEYHFDTGAPFGTVTPLKEVEKAPDFSSDEEKLQYLIEAPRRTGVYRRDCQELIDKKITGLTEKYFKEAPDLWEVYQREMGIQGE